jgi:nucleoside-diphosphate-sugar epimerase
MDLNQPAPSPLASRQRHKLGRPRLLIIGCGDVGLRIVSRLAGRFRVIALTSTPARTDLLRAAGVVPIAGDLDRRHTLGRLRRIATRVVHLAPPGNVGTFDNRTRALVSTFAGAAERAVYISTSGVYGDHGGRLIDETARLRPGNERAMRRIDAENVMRHRLHAAVLRVPGIYAHDRLPLDRLRQKLPALAEEDDVFTNHIHADDLARITIAALARGAAARVYNAVDDSRLKMAHYFDAVADAVGLARPPRLPRPELQAAVSPMMYSFMTESRQLSNRRMKRELRVRLLYPTLASALSGLVPAKTNGGGDIRRSEPWAIG